MFIDYYRIEREKAKQLENGLRVHVSLKSYGATVKIWYPKAKKPTYHYQYKNLEQASNFIKRATKQFEEHKATMEKYRNDRKEGDLTLADPGAIFYTSWGYEQSVLQQHKEWFAMN